MALVFCCPECGATLRSSRTDAVLFIPCPGCGEAIRVPKHAHPAESAIDLPTIPAHAAERAATGLARLQRSLWLFGIALVAGILLATLHLALATRPNLVQPEWYSPTILTLLLLALGCSWVGCIHRVRGYNECESAAASLRVDGWTRLAAWGASLVAAGEFSAVALFLSHRTENLPPEATPFALAGLLAGLLGIAMEFCFLTALHCMLWESAGWQAAGRTSSYGLTIILSVVAGIGVLAASLMSMSSILARTPEAMDAIRTVAATSLGVLLAIVINAALRYSRLIKAARVALAPAPLPLNTRQPSHPPEPYPEP